MALRRPKVLRILVLDTTVSYSDIDRQIIAQIYTCFAKKGTKSNEILGLPSKSEEYYFSIVTYWYLLSHVWLFATLWTAACQGPLSMGFSRQEYWSGLPVFSPGESSRPRNQTRISCIAGGFLTSWATIAFLTHVRWYLTAVFIFISMMSMLLSIFSFVYWSFVVHLLWKTYVFRFFVLF